MYLPSKHTKTIPVVSAMGLPPKNLYNKRFENMSVFLSWFKSIQAGNTVCNYRTHHLVLSHKTYQNKWICYVTIAYCYVTKNVCGRNKFPHVKVACNTKKVGQAWCKVQWSLVRLRGGERGICLAPPPLSGVMHINFSYFWWKTHYSLI